MTSHDSSRRKHLDRASYTRIEPLASLSLLATPATRNKPTVVRASFSTTQKQAMMRLVVSSILPQLQSTTVSTQHLSAAVLPTARRLLKTSTVAMGHGSHSSDNNPHIIEQEKQRNLRGETPEIVPGAPGWNPALASDSEAAVRAEKAPSMDMEDLQAQSINVIQHLHHDGEHPGTPSAEGGVHNPSESPAIKEHMKASEEKLKDAHNPL